MLPKPLVFVDVDTQADFLEVAGALYVDGSNEILGNLARLTRYAREQGISILATACAHAHDDPELARLPAHCLAGTPGQRRVAATEWPGGMVIGAGDKYDGSIAPHLTIQKREFDVFSHPEADRVVAVYNVAGPTFVVYGVATDYCVRAAALGLLERGCKVALVVDAVRAIDRDHEADVLAEFVHRGGFLTLTDVVCGG